MRISDRPRSIDLAAALAATLGATALARPANAEPARVEVVLYSSAAPGDSRPLAPDPVDAPALPVIFPNYAARLAECKQNKHATPPHVWSSFPGGFSRAHAHERFVFLTLGDCIEGAGPPGELNKLVAIVDGDRLVFRAPLANATQIVRFVDLEGDGRLEVVMRTDHPDHTKSVEVLHFGPAGIEVVHDFGVVNDRFCADGSAHSMVVSLATAAVAFGQPPEFRVTTPPGACSR